MAFGLAQGVVLGLMTRRVSAVAIWIFGSVLGQLAGDYVANLNLGALMRDGALVASNAFTAGAYAAATGLALIVIFRSGGRAPKPAVLKPDAGATGPVPAVR